MFNDNVQFFDQAIIRSLECRSALMYFFPCHINVGSTDVWILLFRVVSSNSFVLSFVLSLGVRVLIYINMCVTKADNGNGGRLESHASFWSALESPGVATTTIFFLASLPISSEY